MSASCACARAVEDVVVAACRKAIGNTIRNARPKLILGLAFVVPHVAQACLHDGECVADQYKRCRISDAEEIAMVPEKTVVRLSVAWARTQREPASARLRRARLGISRFLEIWNSFRYE